MSELISDWHPKVLESEQCWSDRHCWFTPQPPRKPRGRGANLLRRDHAPAGMHEAASIAVSNAGGHLQNTKVLIVGAGPVGLTLAIDLGQRGVGGGGRCLRYTEEPKYPFRLIFTKWTGSFPLFGNRRPS
jgi:FAD binding domain